jgi:hypothetical protein
MATLVKLLVIGVAATAIVGCGKKAEELTAEKIIEAQTGGDVDISDDGASVTMKSETGETFTMTTGEDAEMPKDYPADIFTPRDAKLNSSVVTGDGSMINYIAAGTPGEVFKAVRAEMGGKGWKEEVASETPDSAMLHYRKDNRTVQYMIGNEGGRTAVTQVHAVQPPANPTE